jgi:NAD+ kinase
MKQVGLVVNMRKTRGGRFLDILVEWFEQRSIKVVLPQTTEIMYMPPYGCPEIDFQEDVDGAKQRLRSPCFQPSRYGIK